MKKLKLMKTRVIQSHKMRCTYMIYILSTLLTNTFASTSQGEELIRYLLRNTHPASAPLQGHHDVVHVTFGLQLIQIMELDDRQQLLTSKYWVKQTWYNPLMRWNETKWGNIKEIIVDAGRVWTPDIVLYNNAGDEFAGGPDKYRMPVLMRHDGQHIWVAPVTFTSSCNVHSEYFPFDGQACDLKFGSWTLNAARLTLEPGVEEFLGANFVPSSEWDVLEAESKHHSICYEHYGSIPYDDVTFTIRILRKGMSYVFYFLAPCVIVILTTLFSLSLPPESGERMIVIVTNLLCFALFLFMASAVLPRNSDHVATISVFYIVLMVESSFSILMACFIMTAYHYAKETNPPLIPPWLKTVFAQLYVKMYRREHILTKNDVQIRKFSTIIHPVLGDVQLDQIPSLEEETSITSPTSKESRATTFSQEALEKRQREAEQAGQLQTFRNIRKEIEYITSVASLEQQRKILRLDWLNIGIMLDRFYFWIFLVMVVLSIGLILISAYIAQQEFGIPSAEDEHHGDDLDELVEKILNTVNETQYHD